MLEKESNTQYEELFSLTNTQLMIGVEFNKVPLPSVLFLLPSEHQHCQISLHLTGDMFILYIYPPLNLCLLKFLRYCQPRL